MSRGLFNMVWRFKSDLTLEQLEERIVLDGSVEASSGTWTPDAPGAGIFDGSVHNIDGNPFIFMEGLGAGKGIGYWWSWEHKNWGWAFDYETGWWWEDRGSGWDWMNVGCWDFEWYANTGVCVFDGEIHTDYYGVSFI